MALDTYIVRVRRRSVALSESRGGNMKVLICPICGGKDFGYNVWLKRHFCKKEILPLATPQEV